MSEAPVAFDPFANSSHYLESEIINIEDDDDPSDDDDDDHSYEEVTLGSHEEELDDEDSSEVEILIHSDGDSDGTGSNYVEEVVDNDINTDRFNNKHREDCSNEDSSFASLSFHDNISSDVDSARLSSAANSLHSNVTNDSSRRRKTDDNTVMNNSQRKMKSINENSQSHRATNSNRRRRRRRSVNSNPSSSHTSEPSISSTGRSPTQDHNNSNQTRIASQQPASSRASSRGTSSTRNDGDDDNDDDGRCKSIAILGTMSNVGKATISAAICRILVNGGTKCAPFKAQNTSKSTSPALLPDSSRRDRLYELLAIGAKIGNIESPNSYSSVAPTKDQGYGQIGTAQSIQAEACRIVPRVEMNPIFFKSGGQNENNEYLCGVIVTGKQIIQDTYVNLSKRISSLQSMVLVSHRSLANATGAEVIVIQGAGSCSELNLIDGDIVNLPLVRCLQCPWILVANDENGGVFAQAVGTKMCVSNKDWELCLAVIVNKYIGEKEDSVSGFKMLENMIGKPVYAMNFIDDWNVPKEVGICIESKLAWEKRGDDDKNPKKKTVSTVVVAVVYPHTTLSNEVYPLEHDPRFLLEWRRKRLPKPYPATTAIILPGSSLPLLDLKWLQDSGWADLIRTHVAAGGVVLGLCAGYQMLGWRVNTKQAIGLLPISSTVQPAECKLIDRMKGQLYPSGVHVDGFEINCGFSEVVHSEQNNVAHGKYHGISPLLAYEDGKPEGMVLGRVKGTHLHGILRSADARVELLVPTDDINSFDSIQASDAVGDPDPIDKLAEQLQKNCGLDHDGLRNMIFGTNASQ